MKKVLIEFGGALFLYIVIFFGIVAISSRIAYLNNDNIDINNVGNIIK